jgi:hypothetical protein
MNDLVSIARSSVVAMTLILTFGCVACSLVACSTRATVAATSGPQPLSSPGPANLSCGTFDEKCCAGPNYCQLGMKCFGTQGRSVCRPLLGGFFRHRSEKAVSFVFKNDWKCTVQNEEQMAAFGGFNRVLVIDNAGHLNIADSGACGWPNGLYRRRDEREVFRLYGDELPARVGTKLCHVVDEEQLAKYGGGVMEVAARTDLLRGRSHLGSCADP